MLISNHIIKNLIQTEKYLLEQTQRLQDSIIELQKAHDEVLEEQKEAQLQGNLVKKMTDYMEKELSRLESNNEDTIFTGNLQKLTDTEQKLGFLRQRLDDFVKDEKNQSLNSSNTILIEKIKKYENFLLEFSSILNEKVANLEKIIMILNAEQKESRQQKILLHEMIQLFNDEIEELEKTLQQTKSKIVS